MHVVKIHGFKGNSTFPHLIFLMIVKFSWCQVDFHISTSILSNFYEELSVRLKGLNVFSTFSQAKSNIRAGTLCKGLDGLSTFPQAFQRQTSVMSGLDGPSTFPCPIFHASSQNLWFLRGIPCVHFQPFFTDCQNLMGLGGFPCFHV